MDQYDLKLIVAVFLLILTYLIFILLRNNKPDSINHPPGIFGWPVIGETISFLKLASTGNSDRFIIDRTNNYSFKVFKTSLFGDKFSVFCDPSANKLIFSNKDQMVSSWIPRSIHKIMNPVGEIPDYYTYKTQNKRLFSNFLRPDAVQKYVKTMDEVTKQHMDSEWAPNSNITVLPMVKKLAFCISSRIFMGGIEDPAKLLSLEHQFEILSTGLVSVPINLPGTAYRRALNAAIFMHGEFSKMVQEKKLQTQTSSTENLMSYLMSATDGEGKPLSESDIAKMIQSILFASHETVSSLLTNIVFHLAENPQVYALALKEQMEIKSLKGEEKFLTGEDTKRMKYSRNVISEVLRLTPPSFGGFREVAHDFSYEGYTIPKGWKVLMSFRSTHKNPKYFPEPEKFDPTRFEGDGPAPFTFTPFGGGSEMCQGIEYARQEALVFMHNLLVNFKWEKLIPNERIVDTPIPLPAKGLPIKLQKHASDEYAM